MQSSPSNQQQPNNHSWLVVIAIIIFVLIVGGYYYLEQEQEQQPVPMPVNELKAEDTIVEVKPAEEIPEPVIEQDVEPIEEVEQAEEEPVIEQPLLPSLNDSDNWVKEKLTSLTWRKELLKLVIDDDMIRRLVVFTDNFAEGIIAYEHSPLVQPNSKFSVLPSPNTNEQQWQWDENSSKRFNLYVEFLRSFDVESLVDWYFDLKPLIDEAYSELGYPDDDFTETMQDAISRVLDMDIPKDDIVLTRPSVMYKYQSDTLESLSDSEKLLLRLGKDNLLVIKSVLLEFSDKLGRRRGE